MNMEEMSGEELINGIELVVRVSTARKAELLRRLEAGERAKEAMKSIIDADNTTTCYADFSKAVLDIIDKYMDCRLGNYQDAEQELLRRLAEKGTCIWKFDSDGFYNTACGQAFFFDTGNIKENKFIYCSYCRGKIKEKK
jgi:hypothetical protein